ncbi:MAG: hydroxyectoine utilization dehydratase EutB [Trueperaceae bacterium]
MRGPLPGGLSLQDVDRARARLAAHVVRTPLVRSAELSRLTGADVYLKLENLQRTGSFKLRGALNAVLALSDEQRSRGVVTVSTGNHGRAVAFACSQAGARAVVCLSRLVPRNKVSAVEEQGAEVRVVGASQDEAQREAARLVSEQGMALIPPFDHAEVIAGQGTIGTEVNEQLAELAGADRNGGLLRMIVPLSGGGLIAGVALALKSLDPRVTITAVSMERGCAMYRSLEAGKPVEVEEPESLADSLGGGIGRDNRFTFEMVRSLVDEHLLVGEESLAAAIGHAHWMEGQVVEGAGAVGIAGLLAEAAGRKAAPGVYSTNVSDSRHRDHGRFETTVVLLSGGNIDGELHARLTAAYDGSAAEQQGRAGVTRTAPTKGSRPDRGGD